MQSICLQHGRTRHHFNSQENKGDCSCYHLCPRMAFHPEILRSGMEKMDETEYPQDVPWRASPIISCSSTGCDFFVAHCLRSGGGIDMDGR